MSNEIQKWADDFMFTAEKSDAVAGPQAFLIAATPDPLGSIAVAAMAYMGRFVESKAEVTDEERRYYLAEMQKTKLKMPMEAVALHWRIKGVTRSFTHQMVRQRTAAYSQESMRFAVKEDAATAVALPPSLASFNQTMADGRTYGDHVWDEYGYGWIENGEHPPANRSVRQYCRWRYAVKVMADQYMYLIDDGMPAEDARGLTPHNIVTQLNYITNLRNYQDHAGNRLCTQAQFEWRMVWVRMLEAMRDFCTCGLAMRKGDHNTDRCDNWQWVAISELFRPVCYYTGNCQFLAEFDRKCSIRERVMANAQIGRGSEEWNEPFVEKGALPDNMDTEKDVIRQGSSLPGRPVFIGSIHPAEWLMDAGAAR